MCGSMHQLGKTHTYHVSVFLPHDCTFDVVTNTIGTCFQMKSPLSFSGSPASYTDFIGNLEEVYLEGFKRPHLPHGVQF